MRLARRHRLKLALAASLSLLACPAAAGVHQPAAATPFDYRQLEPLFTAHQRDGHIPGVVYGVVADGRPVHVQGLGVQDLAQRRPVTADSLFRIASMTKVFTALAILSLRDQGRLSLDAPAETYVPELRRWSYPTADSPRIRVRDLLHHTAGFVTDDPWGDRQTPISEERFTAMLEAGVPFTRAPGLHMEYSNFGYALLGRIVANVSGMPYRTYVERTLLQPLGMRSTGFEVTEWPAERRALGYRWEEGAWTIEPTMRHGAFGAMGGLQTSAADYSRFLAWLLSAWPARDGPETGPVKRATIRELVQGLGFADSRERTVDGRACRQTITYGMGVRVFGDCDLGLALNHGGGYPGYGSGMLLLPEQGVGLFVFGNRTYSGGSDTLWKAASLLKKAGVVAPRPAVPSPAILDAQQAARAIYRAGDVTAARARLADNFLMDRSAAAWRRELARIRAEVGSCEEDGPIVPRGDLSAAFSWKCERGSVEGLLLLAPTRPPTIQQLRLNVVPPVRD